MWKKIFLTSCLLLCLLSLFSCGFAISYSDIESDLQNFDFGGNTAVKETYLNYWQSNKMVNAWSYLTNNNVNLDLYNGYMIDYVLGSAFITLFSYDENSVFVNNLNETSTTKGYQVIIQPNTPYRLELKTSYNVMTSGQYNGYYIDNLVITQDRYTIKANNDQTFFMNIDKPIYTSMAQTIINDNPTIYTYYNYPQTPPNLFDWTTNSQLQTVSIANVGVAVPYLRWTSASILLGNINQYSNLNLNRSWIDRYVYKNGSWQFLDEKQITKWGRIDVSGDVGYIYLESNVNNISGAIYNLHLEPNDTSQFIDWDLPFYMDSPNDDIQNGSLILNNTFSGDFYNNYNNQINNQQTQDKIDNVSDTLTDDSQVDSMLNDFFSESGENSILSQIDYNPLENPFLAICRNVIQGINDTLLGSGDVTLEFDWYGEHIVLNSNKFVLPNGELKTNITMISNALLFWFIVKYGFKLYEWIRAGRVQNWLRATLDKPIDDYFLF